MLHGSVPLLGGGGEMGVPSPLRLLVNQVLTRCSVMPSVSPSGPRTLAPLFMATSASLQILARSKRWSRVGNWFWNVKKYFN